MGPPGHSRSLSVTNFGTDQKPVWVSNTNLYPIMHHFWAVTAYLSNHRFWQGCLYLTPSFGWTPELWTVKSSCDGKHISIYLTIYVSITSVTDKQNYESNSNNSYQITHKWNRTGINWALQMNSLNVITTEKSTAARIFHILMTRLQISSWPYSCNTLKYFLKLQFEKCTLLLLTITWSSVNILKQAK